MTAAFAIVRKELIDYALNPRITFGILSAALVIVWVAGNLSVTNSSYRALLFGSSEQLYLANEGLSQLTNLEIVKAESDLVDSREMRLKKANFAIVQRNGQWVVFHQAITDAQEAALSPYASALAYFLNDHPDPTINTATDKVGAALTDIRSSVSRLGVVPGAPGMAIVPRTIALIVILISFIIGARSYSRDARSGVLPVLFVARRAGWFSVIAAKLTVSVLLGALLFLLMLESAYLIYGISIKRGLLPELMIQMVAMIASTSLGISAAMLAKSDTYLYILTGVYVVFLIVLSGFLLPLESAALPVRWASYASPLTFSGKLLEEWSFYGLRPSDLKRESLLVGGQALVALLFLFFSTLFAKRRA